MTCLIYLSSPITYIGYVFFDIFFYKKKRVYQFSDTLVFLCLICVYSTCFFCGIMRFNTTPTKADRPMPLIVKLPQVSSAPPMPNVRIRDAMIRLRVSPISTLFFINVLIPTDAIVPKSSSMIPPKTASGMVLSRALILPHTENNIPKRAAIRMTAGSEIFVNEIAPVTSE